MSRRCTALYGKTGSCTLLYAGLAYRSPIQRQFLHAAVKYSTAGTSKIVFLQMKLKTAVQSVRRVRQF